MEAEQNSSEETNKVSRSPLTRALVSIGAVLLGMIAIWIALTIAFGTTTPFFVVSSGSMIPRLEVGDIIIVDGRVDFNSLNRGDIIVFQEPLYGNKVIVHRVYTIYDDVTRRIATKGDHNSGPDDWRVTSKDYIGTVVFTIPKVGLITTALAPPLNYIVIAIVIAAVFMLELRTKKNEQDTNTQETSEETISNIEPENPSNQDNENAPNKDNDNLPHEEN
jgi:signal peptidase